MRWKETTKREEKEMNKKERSGLDDMRKRCKEKRVTRWRRDHRAKMEWKGLDERQKRKQRGTRKRWQIQQRENIWHEKEEMKEKEGWVDEKKRWKNGMRWQIQQKRGMRWRRDNREKEMTKEGCDEEKSWDWTRKNEVTDGMKKKRCKKKRDELKRQQREKDDERGMRWKGRMDSRRKGGMREGNDVSQRVCAVRIHHLLYMWNMQWSMWWYESEGGKMIRERLNSLQLFQTHNTRGSLRLMKRANRHRTKVQCGSDSM